MMIVERWEIVSRHMLLGKRAVAIIMVQELGDLGARPLAEIKNEYEAKLASTQGAKTTVGAGHLRQYLVPLTNAEPQQGDIFYVRGPSPRSIGSMPDAMVEALLVRQP